MWLHEKPERSSPESPITQHIQRLNHAGKLATIYWVLDVTFREDDSRVRDRTAARNLALLRKIALNFVTRDRSGRASRRGRRKMAAWSDDYMFRIITGQADA